MNNWKDTVSTIKKYSVQLLQSKNLYKEINKVDYIAIYPTSERHHSQLINALNIEGKPIITIPTGTIFQLIAPITIDQEMLSLIRIRIYDHQQTQIGYIDYQVDNYKLFKNMYVPLGILSITHNAKGVEMLTLEDKHVKIYFPEIPFGTTLQRA